MEYKSYEEKKVSSVVGPDSLSDRHVHFSTNFWCSFQKPFTYLFSWPNLCSSFKAIGSSCEQDVLCLYHGGFLYIRTAGDSFFIFFLFIVLCSSSLFCSPFGRM